MGDAKVDVTKDETVVRLAMAQHGSVLIELPANDGPRYIIPGDPEMATVDEKALERNKRAIVALALIVLACLIGFASWRPLRNRSHKSANRQHVTVGSKDFTESNLLAEIVAQMLE